MKKLLVVTVIAFVALGFGSCKKDAAGYSPNCGTTPSYASEVKSLIQTNCVSCHSSYASYNGVFADKSAIYSSVSSGSMPKGSTLTNAQKDAILCWINGGAPNN